ncbi:MAG TPA: hypothetical protein PLU30_18575 [Verrucomicrobiae bacterium]|nr:hypothetical protein [Verrucomicrobiae bacterium]
MSDQTQGHPIKRPETRLFADLRRNIAIFTTAAISMPCVHAVPETAPASHAAYRTGIVSGARPSALPESLAGTLAKAGFAIRRLTLDDLCGAGNLTTNHLDCLILTDSPRFPAPAIGAFREFVKAGGDLVLMGGHALSEPVVKHGGAWQTVDEVQRALVAKGKGSLLFDFEGDDFDSWRRGAGNSAAQSRLASDAGVVGKAMRMDLKEVSWYDVFGTELATSPPGGHNALWFWAKGDARTPQLFIEVTEKDGSRWSRAVDIGPEWRPCAVAAGSFLFKADKSPADPRGKKGDHLNMAHAARISLGLAKDRTPTAGGDHTIWIDQLTLGAVEPALAAAEKGLGFIDAFEDYDVYRLSGVERVTGHAAQDWLPTDLDIPGPVNGLSAVAFSFPGESTFVPLLAAKDAHDRIPGWAAGLLIHHDGRYRGSQWAIFGVEGESFYADAAMGRELARILEAFAGGALLERARAECAASAARTLGLTSPGPPRLSIRDGHFTYPDGRRFFIIGANFFNSFDGYYGGGPQWDINALERDFLRMRAAGINAIRVHGFSRFANAKDPRRLPAFLELCRRHGVYILPCIIDHTQSFPTKAQMQAEARRIAALIKDEPMVFGCDLQNEPYWHELALIKDDSATLGARFPMPKDGWRDYQRSLKVWSEDWTSTFPGLQGPLPIPEDPRFRQAFDSANGIYGTWIQWLTEAIRGTGSRHPLAVGYNTIFDCLPANRALDFVAHHCYQDPNSYDDVMINITTLDRLKRIWPDRPITLGEFGYSSGDLVGGRCLDMDAQSVGEFIHYLYALANGYDGVVKWQLCDWAYGNQQRQATWWKDNPESERRRQRRFGMYWPDGTPEGRPKPIACATKFLSDAIADGLRGGKGKLEVTRSTNQIGAGYVFRSDRAFFVGDTRFGGEGLDFTCGDARPANVLLRWNDDSLTVMATRDIDVALAPGKFVHALKGPPQMLTIRGQRGSLTETAGALRIGLLAGETLRITKSRNP